MSDLITLQEWLKIVDDEYLSTFIKEGGASIKFIVGTNDLKKSLHSAIREMCQRLDYQFIELDAALIRAHMPQDMFFEMAKQIDWPLSARRLIIRMAREKGYDVEGIDPSTSSNIFEAIAKVNGTGSLFFLNSIRPQIESRVFKDPNMARDFRVGMTHLCNTQYTPDEDEYAAQPILDWLRDPKTPIGSTRPFSIYTKVTRTTARYFIRSTLHWIRIAGYLGTVILLDSSRVTLAKNPKDGYKYYTRPMTMDHYELLRELIDDIDQLSGTLLIVATDYEFLNEDTGRGARGYGIYQALRTRVMNDVHDKNLVNPVASLVSLS